MNESSHPHDLRAPIPVRLPSDTLRELSQVRPARALAAIAFEYAVIGLTIAAAAQLHWAVYPLAVVIIGARQHALAVLGHDAVHYRLFPSRVVNDWVADLVVLLPVFLTLDGFRKYHGEHHSFLGTTADGNRVIWATHTPDGHPRPEWTYPKTKGQFAAKLLRRTALLTGVRWMIRANIGAVIFRRSTPRLIARFALVAAIAVALTITGTWLGFLLYWVVPFCTWQVFAQYLRLICEHTGLPDDGRPGAYTLTRTTYTTPLEKLLLLPCNVNYHLEHHWYPSVPFYNLPALHEALMAQPEYREHAVVAPSIPAAARAAYQGRSPA